MKKVRIYINGVANLENDQDGKYDERASLESDLKNNEIDFVLTNDLSIDGIVTEFILEK